MAMDRRVQGSKHTGTSTHVHPHTMVPTESAKLTRMVPAESVNNYKNSDPKHLSLDGPIRANRFADSRESPDSRESFQGSRTEPPFCKLRFGGGGLKVANRRFEAIRANRSHVMKRGFSIRANRFARIAPIRVANRRAI